MNLVETKTITSDEFLKEFLPNPKCKDCWGKGRLTKIIRKGIKSKPYCYCVVNKYRKSGKMYHIEGERI